MAEQSASALSHAKRHRNLPLAVRDVIIGMSDGLTVPFAIAAGLASANAATSTIVIAAVVAEIAAGSISMGLGGFLAAQTEADNYRSERLREEREVETTPRDEERDIIEALQRYGLSHGESLSAARFIKRHKNNWVDFMMKFELGLEEPDRLRAVKSAATIGSSYIVGGLIPLAPYLFVPEVAKAFAISIAFTFAALVAFGYLRGKLVGGHPWQSMAQTVLVGTLAAAAAFLLAKLA